MDNHQKTDYISWTVLIGLLLLVVEITFFNKGLIFSVIFSGMLLYFGGKRLGSSIGKLFFALGCLVLFFTTINMIVFKFLIFAIIAYILFHFFKSKSRPIVIEPVLKGNSSFNEARIIRRQSLLKNIFLGKQKTPEDIFEWEDVNIQTGIGDTWIDLSNTVLPKDEAVISIRNFIGNIQILVPYDIEISVSHSVITGTTIIFDQADERLFNQTLHYRTENYAIAQRKIKIITSMGVGRLEVKRI
ncbi:cell wall-active antibiotics response protein [Anaerobacillus alkalidiazotrophicus]|uniref:Cell wall-active antibiotics response protein n=1 Tax=Anaerobacillus alkalidiazotrophicus TaxID=472963 RepID=A0A1S2M908_9BACI|nr:cell wall-active antibiotics response protein LiaF [Anaerobacillus alkalidiazotrophicus]OIJ21262.1 cell wall-active antibiotics response protein [Anaerobacillus alkalidiazotrophicus]